MKALTHAIQRGWQKPGWINHLLYPLSLGYGALMRLRARAYRIGVFARHRLPVPVIVVGNLSVGGVGKTPLVIELVAQLKRRGARVGVIARGYRADNSGALPREVSTDSDPREVGDEPALIARRCRVPVMVGPNRVASARALLARHGCDLLISDDGFQHLALQAQLDIVVIDGARRFGNGWCLPAGPLREPPSALARAGLVVTINSDENRDGEYAMTTRIEHAVRIDDDSDSRPLHTFTAAPVHAVAGIGNPDRFFDQLAAHGIDVIAHPFPDHHAFAPADFAFADADTVVLMTEKDAVKCATMIADRRIRGAFWAVPLQVEIAPKLLDAVLARIDWNGGS